MLRRVRRIEPMAELAATVAALAVVPVILIEATVSDTHWLTWASLANWAIWLVFVADASVKLGVSGRQWLRTWMAWLDLAIIVVSFPALGSLLASARLARLLRLGRLSRATRLARLARLTRALRLLRLLAVAARGLAGLQRVLEPDAFPYVALGVVMVVAVGAGGLLLAEASQSTLRVEDALWWAVTTITTVGYGDFVPTTRLGRLVAVGVMLVGIAFTSLLTANLAAHVTRCRDRDKGDEVIRRLEAVERTLGELAALLQVSNMQTTESSPARDPSSMNPGRLSGSQVLDDR